MIILDYTEDNECNFIGVVSDLKKAEGIIREYFDHLKMPISLIERNKSYFTVWFHHYGICFVHLTKCNLDEAIIE